MNFVALAGHLDLETITSNNYLFICRVYLVKYVASFVYATQSLPGKNT